MSCEAGVADPVGLWEGEAGKVTVPEAFDVAVPVEVRHEVALALRPSVLYGCARALRVGGWLVIVDEAYPPTL